MELEMVLSCNVKREYSYNKGYGQLKSNKIIQESDLGKKVRSNKHNIKTSRFSSVYSRKKRLFFNHFKK